MDGLSVSDVADRVGVQETSIYPCRGTKANLVLGEVLSRLEVEVLAPDTGSLREDLLVLLREIAAFLRGPFGEAPATNGTAACGGCRPGWAVGGPGAAVRRLTAAADRGWGH